VLQSDEQHKSTTYWAGYACQKKDISVPFNLFLVFSIAIVLVVAWAVSLLASIGETELPSGAPITVEYSRAVD
jgi:NADH:ubiquinone oxidoreductase subunit 3 (subunit A)